MDVFYCDHFPLPLPEGHRFPIEKYALVRNRVVRLLGDRIRLRVAPAATREQLATVHTADYLERVFSGELTKLEQRRIGFPWSPEMLHRCRRSTGATIAAAEVALEAGIAAHLSGGTHHAFADQGQGFCVFNDIAVACRSLAARQRIERALIVDLDVHQGNGTASIFSGQDQFYTFSMHGDRNYPFRKTNGDLDVALPDGTSDEEYLSELRSCLRKLPLESCDIVFYLAGADPFEGDRMGRLKITKAGLRERDEIVLQACAGLQKPVAIVMGGGYADVEDVAEIHAETIVIACTHYEAAQLLRR